MKYCRHCGNQLSEDSKYCSECGQEISINNEEDVPDYSQTVSSPVRGRFETPALILGILALIFVILNYLFLPFSHWVGIVLGIIGLTLCLNDRKWFGTFSQPALVLSIVAISLGVLAAIIGAFIGFLFEIQAF